MVIQRIAKPAAFISLAVATPLILAGCTDKADEDAIKVTSTKTECDLDSTEAQTGDVDFSVTNNGTKVTEFYVYGNNNRVLGEVENIGPGVTGNLTVEITDDGRGIDPGTRRSGLENLRMRAAEWDGDFTVGPGLSGRGTRLLWQVPLVAQKTD